MMNNNTTDYNGHRLTPSAQHEAGYVITWVMIAATLLGTLLAGYLRMTTTERTLNIHNIAASESQHAAESLVNYAATEVVQQFRDEPLHAFSSYANSQLDVPDAILDQLAQGRVVRDSLKVFVGSDDGGLISQYIDPHDPANENDPLKGKIAFYRTIHIHAEASASVGSNQAGSVARHAELALQVRDSPFFSSAIFYNLDLELLPEKEMDVYGPVYVNGDAYLGADEGLNFHGPFHAAGNILHGTKLLNGAKYNIDADTNLLGPVRFTDSQGNLVSMKRNPDSSGAAFSDWIDNHPDNQDSWSHDSYAAWHSMVQNGVPIIDIAGFDQYVEDDPVTNADEGMNPSYAIIEPVLSTLHPNYKGHAVRKQKFAWKAGLIFRVSPDGVVTAHTYDRDANGAVLLDAFDDPVEVEVKLPAGLIGDANSAMTAIDTDAVPEYFEDIYITRYREVQEAVYETEDVPVVILVDDAIAALESEYDEVLADYHASASGTDNQGLTPEQLADIWLQTERNSVYARDTDGDGEFTEVTTVRVKDADGNDVQARDANNNLVYQTVNDYAGRTELVKSGFKDHRQYKYGKNLHALTLNVDRLRQLVSDEDADYRSGDWSVDYSEGMAGGGDADIDQFFTEEALNDGLIHSWGIGDMREQVSNIFNDNFHGSYTDDASEKPAVTDSLRGNALYFDGVNDRVELPSTFNLEGNAFTFSVWMNNTSEADGWGRIFSKADGTSTADHIFMVSMAGDEVRVRLKTTDMPDGLVLYSDSKAVNLNEWQHVVVTYDGAQLAVTVDGAKEGSMAVTGDIVQSDTTPVAIGNQPNHDSPFYGYLNQMTFHNRALSTEEIALLREQSLDHLNINTRDDLPAYNPARDWNGIVYIELPYQITTRADNIVAPVTDELAIMLINGEDLPTRTTDGAPEGFSLVTNAPLYLIGNYNADGDLDTGSATAYEGGEVPALLAADTFTLLSREFADVEPVPELYEDQVSFNPTGRRQLWRGINGRWGSDHIDDVINPVEVATALIAGIAPTIPIQPGSDSVKQSGGAHNVIRYLQQWESGGVATEMLYRGSIVVLYENEVHRDTIGSSFRGIYRPPKRTLGFNNLFREGRFPPGTPRGRSYRRAFLTYPSIDQYQQTVNGIMEANNS